VFLTFPSRFSFSFKKYDDSTADTNTLSAPSGVTRDAGAKAYAAKFANSPIPTENQEKNAVRNFIHSA